MWGNCAGGGDGSGAALHQEGLRRARHAGPERVLRLGSRLLKSRRPRRGVSGCRRSPEHRAVVRHLQPGQDPEVFRRLPAARHHPAPSPPFSFPPRACPSLTGSRASGGRQAAAHCSATCRVTGRGPAEARVYPDAQRGGETLPPPSHWSVCTATPFPTGWRGEGRAPAAAGRGSRAEWGRGARGRRGIEGGLIAEPEAYTGVASWITSEVILLGFQGYDSRV